MVSDRELNSMHSQREAKQFFVDKVLAQARFEGMSLSEAEKQMLRWSESDPDFTTEPALVEKLGQETSDEAYEAKVVDLLRHAYRRDVDSNPGARDRYRQAYVGLGQGDHYILIMIDKALGRRLRPWWMFWR